MNVIVLHFVLRDDDGVARVINANGAEHIEHDSGGTLTYAPSGVSGRGRSVDVLIATSRVRGSRDFDDLLFVVNREGELVVADI